MLVSSELSIRVTDQIELRIPEVGDAQEIFSIVDKNRATLREYLVWVDSSKSSEDTEAFLREELSKASQGSALLFKILYKGNCVGLIGSKYIDPLNKTTEVGYWLDSTVQGGGVMTRSFQALIDFYFNEIKLHRIELRCAIQNEKSIAIANRLGFKNEGKLAKALAHYDNTFFDAYLFAKVNS